MEHEQEYAVKPYIISGIEWTLDRKFHFGIEHAKFLKSTIEERQVLPINGVNILFKEDKWDFRPCFRYRRMSGMVFSFGNLPQIYKTSLKYFVLMSLLNSDSKITTVFRRFSDIKKFVSLMDSKGIHYPHQITTKDIRSFLAEYIENHSPKTSSMMHIALFQYAKYLTINFSYDYKIDLKIFDSYNWLKNKVKKCEEANKTPNIPDEYFNLLLSTLIRVMEDKKASYLYRSIACVYLIMSQTGLRISEILALKDDSLQKISVEGIDEAYFLVVREFKPASKNQEYIFFKTYANELTVKAFKTLCNISSKRMKQKDTSFIYIPKSKDLPASAEYARITFHRFLNKYADFAKVNENESSSYEGIETVKFFLNSKEYTKIQAPTSKQFRVHVCTELYYTHHVSLLFIQKFMGHLSDEMQGYYVRSKNNYSLEAEASSKLLKDIISKKVTLLGGKGSEISSQIDRFISEGKFNIKKDMNEILKFLENKIAIRVKRTGFCIKATQYRECSRDAKTNEIYCAYDICPNLCHVYYMAAESYEDFKLLQDTFEVNKKNGFELQASRELQKIKAVCRLRLVPEMEDMKKKIHLLGLSTVIKNYPKLEPIINNYDSIMDEIDLWKKKTY